MKSSKKCTTCNETKPLKYFQNSTRHIKTDGLLPMCKECKSDVDRKYRQSHVQKIKASRKAYAVKNKDKISARNIEKLKEYRKLNPVKHPHIMHGLHKHVKYGTWSSMRDRCNNKNKTSYSNYGGRGIKVSKEFDNFKVWLDYVSSLENYDADGYTLDRINKDGNYEKGNLRWASKLVQAANTSKSKNNTSGYIGVSLTKEKNKYVAQVKINYKQIRVGVFHKAIDAAYARDKYIEENNLPHTKSF